MKSSLVISMEFGRKSREGTPWVLLLDEPTADITT
jgi:hypothetical protein